MTKELRLSTLARSLFDRFAHLTMLHQELGISQEEIIKTFLAYNTGFSSIENGIYSPLAVRLVMHMHNTCPGSWHEQRQLWIRDKLRNLPSGEIVDFGFGSPQSYVLDSLSRSDGHRIILADKYPEAFAFAEKYLEYLYKIHSNNSCALYNGRIRFAQIDFDQDFSALETLVRQASIIIAQDSLEHATNPRLTFEKISLSAQAKTKILLSMPIGDPAQFGFHNIGWQSESEAIGWIQNFGWVVTDFQPIAMNPDIDIFAEDLDLIELLVEAQK